MFPSSLEKCGRPINTSVLWQGFEDTLQFCHIQSDRFEHPGICKWRLSYQFDREYLVLVDLQRSSILRKNPLISKANADDASFLLIRKVSLKDTIGIVQKWVENNLVWEKGVYPDGDGVGDKTELWHLIPRVEGFRKINVDCLKSFGVDFFCHILPQTRS